MLPTETAFVYAPELSRYQLSKTHPFKPVRPRLTHALLRAAGLLSDAQVVRPETLSERQLLTLHDEAFVEAVRAVSRGQEVPGMLEYGLGTPDNPIFPDMHDVILGVCGATVSATRLVASGRVRRAFSPAGGLHHATRNKMSGFCTYNDLALALHEAVTAYGLRVAYIDLDAHHGDGVQEFFYASDKVMTLSIHESGRYLFPGPGFTYETGKDAGRGLSVNMPLEPFTEDASYLETLRAVLPRALAVFKPDLILLQAGADMHRFDPLSNQHMSVQGIVESYRLVLELANTYCEGRVVATGGGGYDPYHTVPRLWSQLWCVLSEQPVPDTVPERWRRAWGEHFDVILPERFDDTLSDWLPVPRREHVERANHLMVQKLLKSLEPIWAELPHVPPNSPR